MPALTDIAKYKRLAELFVLAMKVDPVISVEKNNTALACLLEHGLTERQAESFLNGAFTRLDHGMVRNAERTLTDISTAFRTRDHAFLLSQVQQIIEAGEINDSSQEFFDLCCKYLYHGQ